MKGKWNLCTSEIVYITVGTPSNVEFKDLYHHALFCCFSDDMSFNVSWFALRSFTMDRDPVFLASLDRKGIVTQARRNGSSDVSLERISSLEFRLRIHGCEDQDFGNHYCLVTPWVLSAAGVWQQKMEVKSKPVLITVKMDGKNT